MSSKSNTQNNARLNKILSKFNPWIGLLASLCIIIPSLYDILDNPLKITNDHFILAGGIFLLVVFLRQIFDRIVNLEGME
ncbi:hypothetical protein [Flavobacterium sp.]|uniref:hypothetical protein n=1 Tax=Flavobacterium sp. TaxID=239 RepID=UPI002B721FDE|nr:hypothetical protein [Flavobacterium sp.]HSD08329.1 hypothetical protein [Flavobacterium sp.]